MQNAAFRLISAESPTVQAACRLGVSLPPRNWYFRVHSLQLPQSDLGDLICPSLASPNIWLSCSHPRVLPTTPTAPPSLTASPTSSPSNWQSAVGPRSRSAGSVRRSEATAWGGKDCTAASSVRMQCVRTAHPLASTMRAQRKRKGCVMLVWKAGERRREWWKGIGK